MKLAVIIPAYNRERLIRSALRSILRQSAAAELDVIVVDDGSTDATAAVVKDFARQSPAVRLVQQQNQGVARARNAALTHIATDTDLVTFLDSDDISPDGRLAADLQQFRADPAMDVVYGLMTLAEAIDDDRLAMAADSRSVTVRGLSMSAGIYRKSLLDRVGLFDETFSHAEDADYLFRLFELSPLTVHSDTVAVLYRRHSGNATKNTDALRRGMSRAILRSVQRRRADPQRRSLDGIFDMNALRGVDWL